MKYVIRFGTSGLKDMEPHFYIGHFKFAMTVESEQNKDLDNMNTISRNTSSNDMLCEKCYPNRSSQTDWGTKDLMI